MSTNFSGRRPMPRLLSNYSQSALLSTELKATRRWTLQAIHNGRQSKIRWGKREKGSLSPILIPDLEDKSTIALKNCSELGGHVKHCF